MTALFARTTMLQDGWHNDVRLEIVGGHIRSIKTDAAIKANDLQADIVLPGMSNAHSHVFQRAMSGHTEHAHDGISDNFWTWRTAMYRLAAMMDAEKLYSIACQGYAEMLQTGYTSVAEFHYVHRQGGDAGQSGHSETMMQALAAAADATGIRLTYIPVLYERAGFDSHTVNEQQSQFALSLDAFMRHYQIASKQAADQGFNTGLAAHSIRAVGKDSITSLAALARNDGCPFHLHIAEQTAEVNQCLSEYGTRPVQWLLDNFEIDSQWCLVHATHSDEDEIRQLANSGAVVCLCPTTEANLGDGIFPLHNWLAHEGKIAIGSDSQASINPFEELRWLEYGQRLISRSRNTVSTPWASTGHNLYDRTLQGGAQACGHESGHLSIGGPADFVTLDSTHPTLAGHDSQTLLDALVFSGHGLPIDRVMVNGQWCVKDGRHLGCEAFAQEFRQLMALVGPALVSPALVGPPREASQ
jgi:formimidoylglutamate deiminase